MGPNDECDACEEQHLAWKVSSQTRLARRYTDISECEQSGVEEEHYPQEHEQRPERRERNTNFCARKMVS